MFFGQRCGACVHIFTPFDCLGADFVAGARGGGGGLSVHCEKTCSPPNLPRLPYSSFPPCCYFPTSHHHVNSPLTPPPPQHTGKKWFDCAQCHAESEKHVLLQRTEMTFACKKCKKCFRKETQDWDESDEYCPHCDNHFVIDAKEPKAMLQVEGEDVRVDARYVAVCLCVCERGEGKSGGANVDGQDA